MPELNCNTGAVVKYLTGRGIHPAALGQYLNDHSSTVTVFLHLDNDEAGRIAAEDITRCLEGRCKVVNQPPGRGKDVNELLQIRLRQIREKELMNR